MPVNKIISVKKAEAIIKSYKKSRTVVTVVGGCFDILHPGHIKFIRSAEKLGGRVFILLEPDEKVRLLKGELRPVFSQKERAEMLASLTSVAFIVMLPLIESDAGYDELIRRLEPDVIAATDNDPLLDLKKSQAEKSGGQLKVLPFNKSLSSSRIADLMKKEHL